MKDQPKEPNFPDLRARPFRLERPAKHTVHGDELVSAQYLKEENYADILGAELFQAKDDILSEIRAFLYHAEYRKKLGSVRAVTFERLGEADDDAKMNALNIAEFAMEQLIRRTAQTLDCSIRNYPVDYLIEFEVLATTYKIEGFNPNGPKLAKADSVKITNSDNLLLSNSFGRWLRKFGSSKHT